MVSIPKLLLTGAGILDHPPIVPKPAVLCPSQRCYVQASSILSLAGRVRVFPNLTAPIHGIHLQALMYGHGHSPDPANMIPEIIDYEPWYRKER